MRGEDQGQRVYEDALAFVLKQRRVSIAMLMRQLNMGYVRARHILSRMEDIGIVGPVIDNRFRDVIYGKEPKP